LDAEVERVAGAALERLSDVGVVLIRVDFPDVLKTALAIAADIISFEVIANESAFLAKYDPAITFAEFEAQISPAIRKRFTSAFTPGSPNAVSRAVYDQDVAQLGMLTEAVQSFFLGNRIDAMVFPPVRTPPLRLGEDTETTVRGKSLPIRTAMARNLALGSCAGMPGLVLPAGLTADGLPVGIEFDVRRGGDSELLALGSLLERALGPIQPPRDSH
jgi:mandelamide amidase